MQNLTILQKNMIKKICDDYLNAANGAPTCADATVTYADGIIESQQDKGVFTSLLNAGLVGHGGKGQGAMCGLTELGWQYFLKMK